MGKALTALGILVLLGVLAQPASAQGGAGDPAARLAAADANHDGAVTRAEARAARGAVFAGIDTDNDGFVSAAERRAVREAAMALRQVRDVDGDGRVSRTEFLRAPMRGFNRFDVNDNDVLEAAELDVARALVARRRPGASAP